MKQPRIHSFEPLLSLAPKVLILGTMPSVKSLEQQEYYGNKQNVFWKIMFSIFQQPFSTSYADRIRLIQEHQLALWDVLQSCQRQGSLDSAIKEEKPNDIKQLLQAYPSIHTVVFSSQKAEAYFKKYIGPIDSIKTITMPSPSGANARMTFEEKRKSWEVLKILVKNKKTDEL
ncbi:DNA-deoxyinosine glycosylase [Myroides sp. C15-4]|uniref:DNA-deoxyinosine glycosylase n=1 Tax=Myroides sp. C15-4 TaxID=3400532 RepID=UPI003D2F96C8